MVDQTNLYAQQHFQEHPDVSHRPCLNYWKKTMYTSTEKLQFFVLVITMGTIHYPKLEDYWDQYWPYSTLTSRVMSRNHFSLILKFLYINNKKAQKQNVYQDMINYRRDVPLLHHLLVTFKLVYNS